MQWESVKSPTIYRGREHGEVAVPLSALLKDGRLDVFDEVKAKKYFQLYSRGTDLVFQCGGYVGLIPVNGDVAIEVAPRVKISNLDRILSKVGAPHALFTSIDRQYPTSEEALYLIDLIADALTAGVEEIVEWGRHKEYQQIVHRGNPRGGRISSKESLRLRAKYPGSIGVVTSRYERTANNLFNGCIRLAIEKLSQLLIAGFEAKRIQQISRLNIAWQYFSDVDFSDGYLNVATEVQRRISEGSLTPPYEKTLPLAIAVLRDLGPSQNSSAPGFSLGSLAFDLSDAFERYVRICLSEHCTSAVIDGNLAAPAGARKLLFAGSSHPLTRAVATTPDIVIRGEGGASVCVLDAKYKPYSGMPDRDDINQALAYALAYNSPRCGLIYPTNEPAGRVEDFGRVGGVSFYGFSIGLNAQDLPTEERRFAIDVCSALGLGVRTN